MLRTVLARESRGESKIYIFEAGAGQAWQAFAVMTLIGNPYDIECFLSMSCGFPLKDIRLILILKLTFPGDLTPNKFSSKRGVQTG